jgi:phage-related protein
MSVKVLDMVANLKAEGADETKKHLEGVNREAERGPGLFGKLAGGVLGFVAGGALVGGVTSALGGVKDALGGMVSGAMDAQASFAETVRITGAMGKSTGVTAEQVDGLSQSFMKLTGVDDDVVRGAENVLARFSNINKDAFPKATGLALDLSRAMGVDANTAATMLGKALEHPEAGLGRLSKTGATLTEEQKKQIKSMVAHGDSAGAAAIIMGSLDKAVGGAAKTFAGTAAGGMQTFETAMGNIQKAIGAGLLPAIANILMAINPLLFALSDAIPGITGVLVPVIMKLLATLLPLIPVAVSLAQTLLAHLMPVFSSIATILTGQLIPTLLRVAQPILSALLPAVMRLIEALLPVLVPVLQLVGWLLGTLLVPVILLVANVLTTLIGWIVQLIAWLGHTGDGVKALGQGWSDFVAAIQAVIGAGFKWVQDTIKAAVEFVVGLFKWLYDHNTIFHDLVDNILKVFTLAKLGLEVIWKAVSSAISGAWNGIVSTIGGALGRAWDAIRAGVGAAASAIGSVLKAITGPIDGLGSILYNAGRNLIQMLINGIKNMVGGVGRAVGDIAGSIGRFLGFHSPTEEGPGADADQWMPNLGTMLATGLRAQADKLGESAKQVAASVAGQLGAGSGQIAVGSVSGSLQTATLAAGVASAGSRGGSPGSSAAQPITIVLDGRVVGRGLLPHITNALQQAGITITR